MKPKIAVYGVWHKSDSLIESEFEFMPMGYPWELPNQPDDVLATARKADAIIIAGFGFPVDAALTERVARRFTGKRIGYWSWDSHHDSWRPAENRFARMIRMFTSHRECLPLLHPTTEWLPCCVPNVGVNDSMFIGFAPPRLRQFDLVSFAHDYPESFRQKQADIAWARIRGMGFKFIYGQCDKPGCAEAYQLGRVAVNVAFRDDVNLRVFECLLANCRHLTTTPLERFEVPQLEGIAEASMQFSPESINPDVIREAISRGSPNTSALIRSKHMLYHRYCEMARKVLQ